ncbi:MAG: hypothetical protein QNL04_05815 [SAR324 cluster bacterium]|nr:hypothetical protein [SAR324 cluster bacterium]
MGGAFSAVSDDATGAYYNPGALVFGADDSMISISNSTNFQRSNYQNDLSGDLENDIYGWGYLVSYAGYFKRNGDFIFGFSYAIDNAVDERQTQTFATDYTASVIGQDVYYKYGPSLSYQANKHLGLGATLYLDQREYSKKSTYYRPYQSSGDRGESYDTDVWGSELGAIVKLGALVDLEKVAIALVVSKSIGTHREYHQVITTKDASLNRLVRSSSSSNDVADAASQLTLGFAWFASPYLLFSMDIDQFQLETTTKESVTNLSAGVEYYLTPAYVLRLGTFTNKDNNIAPDSDSSLVSKVDMAGATLGLAISSGDSIISAGVAVSSGTGTGQTDPFSSSEIQDINKSAYQFFLGVTLAKD